MIFSTETQFLKKLKSILRFDPFPWFIGEGVNYLYKELQQAIQKRSRKKHAL